MNNDQVMPARAIDQLFVKRAVGHCGRRIVRIRHYDRLGTVSHIVRNIGKIELPVIFRFKRIQADCRTGHHRTERKNGIARIWREDQVVRAGKRECNVRNALLRTTDRHDLIFRERHPVTALIPILHSREQHRCFGQRILVLFRFKRRTADRFHHMRIRLEIRRADRQVDNVRTTCDQRALTLIEPIENIAFCGLSRLDKLHIDYLPNKNSTTVRLKRDGCLAATK